MIRYTRIFLFREKGTCNESPGKIRVDLSQRICPQTGNEEFQVKLSMDDGEIDVRLDVVPSQLTCASH